MTPAAVTVTGSTGISLRLVLTLAGLLLTALLGSWQMNQAFARRMEGTMTSLGNSARETTVQVTRLVTQMETVTVEMSRFNDTLTREGDVRQTHLQEAAVRDAQIAALEARIRELERTQ